uniref:Uncharacterized protein n=1 Tax=Ananas comosus var. bracteatus TaxID=296719 RepID=A0A6V7PLQ6_ANACO|nr:unnamed protein product [Ananas comosus var. bracteatus]
MLKAFFGITLYRLNRSTSVKLGVVLALFSLVVKDMRDRRRWEVQEVEGAEDVVNELAEGGSGNDTAATAGAQEGRPRQALLRALNNAHRLGSAKAEALLRALDGAGASGRRRFVNLLDELEFFLMAAADSSLFMSMSRLLASKASNDI